VSITHENKVAIITGASRGIGLGIAKRLVTDGARVIITARQPEALAEAVEALGGPAHALAIAGHADDASHQEEVVAAARETFGRLDYLVNNAGINPSYGPMLEMDIDSARKILEVNVLSAFSWTQKVVGAGLGTTEAPGGAIVNVASIAGLAATGLLGWYAVSKAAMIHLTTELGYQLGPDVRVNAVAPGVVKTVFAQALYEGREEKVAKRYPLRRLGVPADISGAVSFLLSGDSSWMTGQTVVLDGGAMLAGPM
jgi:NAD(P)-dependent dehydrogenase (short-subunit alcohol dehydrogenase family)